LFNVCDTALKQCNKGEEGCNNDCTLAGSSALYSVSSVCGDGLPAGIGEYGACEVATSTLASQYGTTDSNNLPISSSDSNSDWSRHKC
jgi:hypothetical protein